MLELGLIGALCTGIVLALMGGGGSILAIPTLVYLFHLPTKNAIVISLAVEVLACGYASYHHFKNKNYDLQIGAFFVLFSIPGAQIGAYAAQFINDTVQMLIFGCIVLISALMLPGTTLRQSKVLLPTLSALKMKDLVIEGFLIGMLTGLIGVGGGFMIVPILVLVHNFHIKRAIGTSVMIVTINSLSGLVGYLSHTSIDWPIFGLFGTVSLVGLYFGLQLLPNLSQKHLKKIFSVFLLIVGTFIVAKTIITMQP